MLSKDRNGRQTGAARSGNERVQPDMVVGEVHAAALCSWLTVCSSAVSVAPEFSAGMPKYV